MGRLKRRFLLLQSAWGRQRLNDEVLSNAGRSGGDRPPILGTFSGLASYEMNWKTVDPSLFRAVFTRTQVIATLTFICLCALILGGVIGPITDPTIRPVRMPEFAKILIVWVWRLRLKHR